jgi:hypothetical protein
LVHGNCRSAKLELPTRDIGILIRNSDFVDARGTAPAPMIKNTIILSQLLRGMPVALALPP